MKSFDISVRHSCFAVCTALLVGACTTNENVPELQEAQAVVQRVQTAPLRNEAAANVAAAVDALAAAEQAAADGDEIERVRHLAFVARRNAEIASEKMLAAQAEQQIQQSEVERQQVLLQARTLEAQRARERLEHARTAAKRANEEREELKQQISEMKEVSSKSTDRGLVLTLNHEVLFGFDQATLKPGAMRTMDRLASFLKEHEQRTVTVEGHTDNIGSDDYNMKLSRERAEAVRMALIERGVPAPRIRAIGRGESLPVASNNNVGGRQENRRVEIVLPDDGHRVAQDGD